MESAREHWKEHSEAWIQLTRTDPDYELFNKPRFLELVPEPGRRTLDVGCGEGRVARELAALGHRVVGFDGSPMLASAAAAGSPAIPAGVADTARLPVASGSIDLVVCFMVLMDVEALDLTLAEIARVLEPGGVLCAAIMHPVFTSGFFVDGDPNQTFYMGDYARERRHILDVERRDGGRFVFRIEHRPIERYSRALESAGFVLTHVREPVPDDDAVAACPQLAKFRRVSEFLHFRAQRGV